MEKIRKATLEDSQAIIDIYNQAVEDGLKTADTEKVSPEDGLSWIKGHLEDPHPVFVHIADEKITGWLSISPYRPGRKALRFTKEVSAYIHRDYRAKGAGSKLVEYTIEYCRKEKIKNIFAILLDTNKASIGVLEKFGFSCWGHLPKVGDLEGRELGRYYYGKGVS